ncbi:hypothetical protein VTK26DRAFT_5319 [Humicola hyalothermophila]
MVEHPVKLTLRELIRDYEQVTYPVTLVCAGNRRKEQNMVRKTKGFSWGAAGLSTALWTGVTLPELLARAVPKRGARYVCFEGADKLPNGYYGTSVKLSWAMDPDRGMMVAHKMNGEPLHPDHGKPLRIVIPGQIGGRSVKWLKRIIVTAAPSDNWYHIYDNRVLPTTISPEESANLPDTWKDERYAIYDLNTNSAICYPAHDERVPLLGGAAAEETYKLRGYAYSGGGKRVTRLEVTLDQGRTWLLANVTYPEDQYRLAPEGEMLFGGRLDMSWRETCFCWCFWDLDVPLSRLQAAGDVMIRAMDDSMMVQPRDMYWSVLGMMNNPWYRVVIHKEGDSLRFEHPTQPALIPGGWMERVKKEGGNLTNGFWGEKVTGEDVAVVQKEPAKEISMINDKVARQISLDELRQHEGEDEPWFVVNGQVYDGTAFLEGHPGGAASITNAAGQDVSEEFLAIHSENAKAMLRDYHIGTLSQPSSSTTTTTSALSHASPTPTTFPSPKTFLPFVLTSKTAISPDTKILTFTLPPTTTTPQPLTPTPPGQHLLLRLRDPATREAIIRSYTPLAPLPSAPHELRLLVKMYADGRMTRALDALPPGHPVDVKGPVGGFEYRGGGGRVSVRGRERKVRRLAMVCGGSGVTPVLAVMRAVVEGVGGRGNGEGDGGGEGRDRDETECVLVDGNRGEEDILCREELERLVRESEGSSALEGAKAADGAAAPPSEFPLRGSNHPSPARKKKAPKPPN